MTDTVAVSIPVARLNHAVLFVRDADRRRRVLRPRLRLRGRRQRVRRQGRLHAGRRWRQPPRPRPLLGRAGGAAGAARLGRALPPRLGGPDDRGPGRRRARSCPRPAHSAAPPTTASRSRSTATIPDGNEFEIMWRVPRESWGELRGARRGHAARHRRRGPRWGAADLGSGRAGEADVSDGFPTEGMELTHILVVADIDRARAVLSRRARRRGLPRVRRHVVRPARLRDVAAARDRRRTDRRQADGHVRAPARPGRRSATR